MNRTFLNVLVEYLKYMVDSGTYIVGKWKEANRFNYHDIQLYFLKTMCCDKMSYKPNSNLTSNLHFGLKR